MKKIPLLITLVVGTSLVVPKIHAQEVTQPLPEKVAPGQPSLIQNIKETLLGTDDKPAFIRDVEDKKEQMRKFREDKIKADRDASISGEIVDTKKTDSASIETKIKDRVNDTIVKLDNLTDRIESRIEKLKKAGADVTEAEDLIKKAREVQADTLLQFELLEWNELDADQAKANTELLKTIRADVVLVHSYLTTTVELLKDAQTKADQKQIVSR